MKFSPQIFGDIDGLLILNWLINIELLKSWISENFSQV